MTLRRPRRQIITRPAGYSVEPAIGAPFVTPDRNLAEQVAQEYDRIDPLPFPPHDCTIEVTEIHDGTQVDPIAVICEQCGRRT